MFQQSPKPQKNPAAKRGAASEKAEAEANNANP
jgi:hypothetical protein